MSERIKPIVMPKWGLSMKEGKVVGWLVDAGTRVGPSDEIMEVETEKIANVVEAGDSGTLRRIVGEPDTVYPVKALLGVLADERIRDVFSTRIAGNFVNRDIIGSLEYATKLVGAKLILALGHSDCGAVKGAIDHVTLGNLTATLNNILPAVDQTETSGARSSKNKAFVQAVADTNVRLAAKMLQERSKILDELVDVGALKIVPAMHDVATGKVSLLG